MLLKVAQLLQRVAYNILAIVKSHRFTCNDVLAMAVSI